MRMSFARLAALSAVIVCGSSAVLAQSAQMTDLGIGKLLVSARDLSDPNFAESVVLLIQYDEEGAVGLMINRRTRAAVSRVIQSLDAGKHASDPIYIGGPVEMAAVFGLVKSRKKPDKGIPVLRDLYLISSKAMLEKTLAAVSDPSDLRLYVGYCGWAAGQLESEVRRGGWWIFDGNVALVFDPSPASVWSRLIGRTERQIVEAERPSILAEISGALRAAGDRQGAL